MCKKTFIVCVLLAVCCTFVWAGGARQGNESRTAEDPSGFTDSIDISEKKTGKWNYYLEARDKGGNISLSGPDNIYVDPESDLPRVTIINPMPGMRVQGNLNIVGIAVDDDAVDHVEFTVTRGRDGKGEEVVSSRAAGADYWSFFLDTTDPDIWTDGVYTITAWAVDSNGLSGISEDFKPAQHKKHVIAWHLDRKKPDTIVTSHEVGALVSGKIKLRGTVSDGNGVSTLGFSLDEGKRYTPVRISQDRRTGDFNWEIQIDTRTFEDGPAVLWFQARDGQGTLGTAAHLLFSNNTGPEVEIVYPVPDAPVNGIFTIAGYSSHPVGLKSVSWSAGRIAQGRFDLLTGNPWWSTDIDLRGQRLTSIDIEIRAEDVSGNVTVKRQRYRVDQNADLPVVHLIDPSPGLVRSSDRSVAVRGTISDDDGVTSVFYSVNSGPAVEIPTSGYFQFSLRSLTEGANNVEIWAKDVTGVIGNKVTVRGINVPGVVSEPRITTVTTGTGRNAVTGNFFTGMKIAPEQRMTMEVAIKASAIPSSASVAFGDMQPVTIRPAARDGLFRATVQIPAELSSRPGLTRIRLSATDRIGSESVYDEYVFVNTSAEPSSNPVTWVRQNELEDGRYLLGSPNEVLMGVSAEPLNSVMLTGSGAGGISIEVDQQGRVVLKAMEEGNFGPLNLRIERPGMPVFVSDPFRVLASFSGPEVTLIADVGKWAQTNVTTRFNVQSTNRINAVEYSLNMGDTWRSLMTQAEISALRTPVNVDVTRTIDVSGLDTEDGSIAVLIRATNDAGLSSTAEFSVLKDTSAPGAELIVPVADARVNGTIRMGFSIKEGGELKSVVYNRPAAQGRPAINKVVFDVNEWNNDHAPLFLEVLMDSIEMPLDENMRFIFEDTAGNSAGWSVWPFVIDRPMDIPVVQVILPLDNEVITTDFIVSGVMFDDDAIKQVYWKIDSGEEFIVVAENGFSIPISLSTLSDNGHTVTVVAEDIYGVKSAPVTRNFRVSLSEPAGAVTFPLFDTVLRDSIQVRGTAFDRNGIKGVQVSVDNGNTFNNARGTTEWNYEFNTKILRDGPHVVFFKVFDNYDISATYASMINVDNTAPEIVLDSPGDGSFSIGNVSIMGRALDPNLEEVRIEMRSLEGATVRADLRTRVLSAEPVIKEALDLTGQRDGLYDVEVVARDKAGNITRVSRNFQLARETFKNFVEILYPLDNENMRGEFNLYGFAGGTDPAGTVTIRINDTDVITNEVDESGYFRFALDNTFLNEGVNTVLVSSNFGGNTATQSRRQNLVYKADGPWVTIDSFGMGDFAFERPYLYGRTGYMLSEEDQGILADRHADRYERNAVREKTPSLTEISFDNGKTFIRTSPSIAKDIDYRFRLETGEMTEGMHYILVRSTMRNGEIAVTRMLVQVDKTPPVIRLIAPEPGGRYNQEIAYSASATDNVELVSLTYHLRKGDKAAYEVPGFLQGLYIESIIPPFIRQLTNDAPVVPFGGGATYMDVGLGLSFFDDNVKIQGQYGFMFQDIYESMGGVGPVRYGGHVLGIKLLASVYTLPLGAVWGPDWDWLFASFSVGANFSLFDMANTVNDAKNPDGTPKYTNLDGTPVTYTQSGKSTWMSALLLQVEFPKVTIPKRKNFRTFSLFTEGQLWFVPTDVDAEALGIETVLPKVIMGMRLYIF